MKDQTHTDRSESGGKSSTKTLDGADGSTTVITTASSTTASSKTAFFDIGGRRFLLAIGTLVSINALLWFGRMTDIVYRDVIVAVIAVYVAGNTLQKIKAGAQANE